MLPAKHENVYQFPSKTICSDFYWNCIVTIDHLGGSLQVFPKKWLLVLTFCLFLHCFLHSIWFELCGPLFTASFLLYKHSKLWMPPCCLCCILYIMHISSFIWFKTLSNFSWHCSFNFWFFRNKFFDFFLKLFEEFGKLFLMWTLIVAGFLNWFVFIWFSSFKFMKTCFVVQFIVYLIDFIWTWEKNVVLDKIFYRY